MAALHIHVATIQNTIYCTLITFLDPIFNITTLSERFKNNGVAVTLGLTGENAHLIMYNISVIPQVLANRYDSVERELSMTVPYNAVLNVSISASMCGGGTTNQYIELYYGQ